MAGEEFAELLRELKERSGLSYGALGKRLHMSASTVHRYVNGDVVPTEYAPVERLARICRATPEELVELHRRWVRADALRGVERSAKEQSAPASGGAVAAQPRQGGTAAESAAGGATAGEADPVGAGGTDGEQTGERTAGDGGTGREESRGAAGDAASDDAAAGSAGAAAGSGGVIAGGGAAAGDGTGKAEDPERDGEPAVEVAAEAAVEVATVAGGRPGDAAGPARRGRKKWSTAVLAGTGIVAVAAATALVVNLVPGDSDRAASVRDAAVTASAAHASGSHSASTGPSASPSETDGSTPTATASDRAHRTPGAGGSGPAGAAGGADADQVPAVPVTVNTTPYYWDVPCEQSMLVDRSPQNVPPPPVQQDAEGWAAAMGAVAADHQTVKLTVQGTGAQTVVLQDLHVRVVGSSAPLTWNKYAMGNGCGGGVDTAAFDIALDAGNPLVQPVAGQRPFPYKVSESDPEVFYVKAHTSGHDVRWYLELDWSSGDRHGTVRIDDHGKPFRTSASGKAYYAMPLGQSDWELIEDF
ncbi:helix-turn-helix transcriptional regulator [Streptomyces thermoviolaceus]|uniref:helix-turn-helix domain-containing protein n=1 Tax=Streptomyces thermoviolaceus TaxID=1952 RepID=UPI0033A9B084